MGCSEALCVCGGCTSKGDNCRFCGSRVLGVAGVLSILSRRSAGVSEGRRQLPHPEIEIRTLLEQLLELEHSARAVAGALEHSVEQLLGLEHSARAVADRGQLNSCPGVLPLLLCN